MSFFKGVKSIFNSVQIKFALVFIVLLAALLIMLNIYPSLVARDLVFSSKNVSLSSQALVMSSALATPEALTADAVSEVMGLLDLRSLTRVMVTDESALVLYDTASCDPCAGRTAMLRETDAALSGKVYFSSVYDGSAFMSTVTMPISVNGSAVGSVYLYEYDSELAVLIAGIQSNLGGISVMLSVLSVILLIIFSRGLTARIRQLVQATNIVSEGDYDYLIDIRGHDELSELGEEFNSLTQRLKSTEEMRRRFVSDASHELKTPLASIRLLTDSILGEANMDEATMRDFVNDIGNEAERLQRTTEKLLSLSRLDSGTGVSFERVDLSVIVEKTLHPLKLLAESGGVTIATELQRGCFIYGSEDLLYSIAFNLAENGIKYNLPGGSVHITTSHSDDSVTLLVRDTGIGVPEEDIPHIFSRFYRVDKARSRAHGGSGLGLSIVYDAVKLHGGDVSVNSTPGEGSVFTVTFPAYISDQEDA